MTTAETSWTNYPLTETTAGFGTSASTAWRTTWASELDKQNKKTSENHFKLPHVCSLRLTRFVWKVYSNGWNQQLQTFNSKSNKSTDLDLGTDTAWNTSLQMPRLLSQFFYHLLTHNAETIMTQFSYRLPAISKSCKWHQIMRLHGDSLWLAYNKIPSTKHSWLHFHQVTGLLARFVSRKLSTVLRSSRPQHQTRHCFAVR